MGGTGTPDGAYIRHDLASFTGVGYDRGRSLPWQVAWFAVQHTAFKKWWFPARLRPVVLRLFGAEIGERVLIRSGVRVHWPWKLRIGPDCWIGEDCWILNLEPVHIGHDVCVSQGAFLCTGSHHHDDPAFEFDNGAITIGDSSWVAAQALVLRGVTVGDGALVGARAVVFRDVPVGGRVTA